MADIEVCLDLRGRCRPVGIMRRHAARGAARVTFAYAEDWTSSAVGYAIDPALPLGPGTFRPAAGHAIFGAIGDSAPDSWGRTLMRRRERRTAEREGRAVRTLQETDFLLGVSDEARLGALRFRRVGDNLFQAPSETAIPGLIALGTLRSAADRILKGVETDEDLLAIYAPGSSLGGARPKGVGNRPPRRVVDCQVSEGIRRVLAERRWEAIALDLAAAAGIRAAAHDVHEDRGRPIFVSRRFDRGSGQRIPFISALAMTEHRDGERGSYLEIVDALTACGAQAVADRVELFKRIAFSILVSNTDDHLRNHAFLRLDASGWTLSPAYDINPTPPRHQGAHPHDQHRSWMTAPARSSCCDRWPKSSPSSWPTQTR